MLANQVALLVTLSLSLAILPAGVGATEAEHPFVRNALASLVTIHTYGPAAEEVALGSGFRIKGGDVVTNAHVLAGAASARILGRDGKEIGTVASVGKLDEPNDLAILTLPNAGLPFLPLALNEAQVGDAVWAFGAPLGLDGTVSTGIVSAFREINGNNYTQITAPISSGSSGGPLVNEGGQVIGVVSATLSQGQNLNFAVPVAKVRGLVAQKRGKLAFPQQATEEPQAASSGGSGQSTVGDLADAWAQAKPITVDGKYEGSLDASDIFLYGPFECYRFIGQRGSHIEISVQSTQPDMDLSLDAGEELYGRHVAWDVKLDQSSRSLTKILTAVLPETGEYMLSLHCPPGAFTRYLLNVRELEAGNRPSEARWGLICVTNEVQYHYDRGSTMRNGSLATAWVRCKFSEEQTNSEGRRYDVAITRYLCDCSSRRFKITAIDLRIGSRVVVSRESPAERQQWQAITPGSIAEGIMDAMCAP